jgi:hypothetical protein
MGRWAVTQAVTPAAGLQISVVPTSPSQYAMYLLIGPTSLGFSGASLTGCIFTDDVKVGWTIAVVPAADAQEVSVTVSTTCYVPPAIKLVLSTTHAGA